MRSIDSVRCHRKVKCDTGEKSPLDFASRRLLTIPFKQLRSRGRTEVRLLSDEE